MKKLFLSLLLTFPVFAQEAVPETPSLLPVFRCVLDERPRILVTLLGEKRDHALAFHTESGTLWKAWKSEPGVLPVLLKGALYDGKHGPQPTSQGELQFIDEEAQLFCSDKEAELQYLGHLVDKNGAATLRWAFQDAAGKQLAIVRATPSLVSGKVTLTYTLEAQPADDVKVTVRKPGSSDAPTALEATAPLTLDF